MFHALLFAALFPTASSANEPQRRVAMAANSLGMQRYRAGEMSGAAEQFRVAIDFDGSYVVAHYNLACVAARLGDTKTSLRELHWLADSKDPIARAKLQKAASDPDLDTVSTLPEVRTLLGQAPFEKSRPSAWLTERDGAWSTEAASPDCVERTYTLLFRGDDVTLTVHEECDGKPAADGIFSGRLDLAPVAVTIAEWKAWPGAVPLAFSACPGVDAPGSCFTLSSGSARLGPFHRGLPLPRNKPIATTSKP
jgi:hypothetical protein